MHRQQSRRSLRSLHLGAIHFVFNLLLALTAFGLTGAGFIITDHSLLWIGTTTIALFLVSAVIFFLSSLSWHCPLCMGKLWVRTGCRRHRKVKRAFGTSYRLRIALRVIFYKSYRCPYCGEPFSTRKAHR